MDDTTKHQSCASTVFEEMCLLLLILLWNQWYIYISDVEVQLFVCPNSPIAAMTLARKLMLILSEVGFRAVLGDEQKSHLAVQEVIQSDYEPITYTFEKVVAVQ